MQECWVASPLHFSTGAVNKVLPNTKLLLLLLLLLLFLKFVFWGSDDGMEIFETWFSDLMTTISIITEVPHIDIFELWFWNLCNGKLNWMPLKLMFSFWNGVDDDHALGSDSCITASFDGHLQPRKLCLMLFFFDFLFSGSLYQISSGCFICNVLEPISLKGWASILMQSFSINGAWFLYIVFCQIQFQCCKHCSCFVMWSSFALFSVNHHRLKIISLIRELQNLPWTGSVLDLDNNDNQLLLIRDGF